jgi:anionic cell wall polymer biosynthesis LytR-Cps2A-Psr (LCP) family protein
MRTRVRIRAGLLLALSLVTAVPPAVALGAAPQDATTAGTLAGAASHLVQDATAALSGAGAAVVDAVAGAVAPAMSVCSGSGPLDLGNDGRLTVLLLGSDYRPKPYIGERMDTIIVATRRKDGSVAAASIPRDTVFFPKAGGGTTGTARVNGLYFSYKRTGQFGRKAVDCRALDRMRRDVATALRTEIDHYAMVRFRPFVALVDSVGHVPVNVPGPIIDPEYGRRGIFFPDVDGYALRGDDTCGPRPDRCHSALAYVRSRKGTQAGEPNNDFRRSFRQHGFILRAIKRVRSRGTGDQLSQLLTAIRNNVHTSLPTSRSVALELYDLFQGVSMSNRDRVVLGPRRYAYQDARTPRYTYRLRLPAVRQWIDEHFES